jgi:hypothetical protein
MSTQFNPCKSRPQFLLTLLRLVPIWGPISWSTLIARVFGFSVCSRSILIWSGRNRHSDFRAFCRGMIRSTPWSLPLTISSIIFLAFACFSSRCLSQSFVRIHATTIIILLCVLLFLVPSRRSLAVSFLVFSPSAKSLVSPSLEKRALMTYVVFPRRLSTCYDHMYVCVYLRMHPYLFMYTLLPWLQEQNQCSNFHQTNDFSWP